MAPRLHLLESWTDDKRTSAAGVPGPFRAHKAKSRVALELLDQSRAEGIVGGTVVADAGYDGAERRDGLAARGVRYVVGVSPENFVFTQQPHWTRRPRLRRGQSQLGRSRTVDPFAEDAARAAHVRTVELAEPQDQGESAAVKSKTGKNAAVAAVNVIRELTADRARSACGAGRGRDGDQARCETRSVGDGDAPMNWASRSDGNMTRHTHESGEPFIVLATVYHQLGG